MKNKIAVLAAAILISSSALAAVPQYVTIDHSPIWPRAAEIAKTAWVEHTTEKITKLYPPKTWGFLTEVDGGFDKDNLCVVTTRVTMLPFGSGVNRKSLMYKPKKTVATFGTTPKSSKEQCVELATAKLREAIHAMMEILATDP
jgi:hypothetical protein